ncbi:MAG TPA: ferritin-like domain-containing protein, partial [Gemmatirosa sp.]
MNEIVERSDEAARIQRRDFMRLAGLGGAAVALAACGVDPTRATQAAVPAASAAAATPGSVTYDFSNDIGVLNFAYAMELLGQSFYSLVTSNAQFTTIFPANEQIVFADLLGHETAHRDFFTTALASAGIVVTPNWSAVNFASRADILAHAITLENTCVAALNGGGMYLHNPVFLGVAGKLVSVEARQASTLLDIQGGAGRSGAFAPSIFDPADTPQQVISIVQPFVQQTLHA